MKRPKKTELKLLKKFFKMGFGSTRAEQYVMPCSVCGMEWNAEDPWHWCPVCGQALKPQANAS